MKHRVSDRTGIMLFGWNEGINSYGKIKKPTQSISGRGTGEFSAVPKMFWHDRFAAGKRDWSHFELIEHSLIKTAH